MKSIECDRESGLIAVSAHMHINISRILFYDVMFLNDFLMIFLCVFMRSLYFLIILLHGGEPLHGAEPTYMAWPAGWPGHVCGRRSNRINKSHEKQFPG